MANLVVAVITLASCLGVVMSLLQSSLAPQPAISASWKEMRAETRAAARTELEEADLQVQSGGAGIRLALANTGGTSLRDYGSWDVIVTYRDSATSTDFQVRRLTYTESAPPGDNEWSVSGIYRDAVDESPEVFDPGILDPGEQAALLLRIEPPSATSTAGQIVLSTTSGVTVSAQFAH